MTKRIVAIRIFEFSIKILNHVTQELKSIWLNHAEKPYNDDLHGIIQGLQDIEMSINNLTNRTRRNMEAK